MNVKLTGSLRAKKKLVLKPEGKNVLFYPIKKNIIFLLI